MLKDVNKINFRKTLKHINLAQTFGLNRFKMQAIVTVVLILFFVSNFFLSTVSFRLDFSKGKAYTLTPATKKILKNLDDTVTIEFVVSSDVPTQLSGVKREVTDLIREYDNESTKVNAAIVDPQKDEKAKAKAQQAGLPTIPFRLVSQNKAEVVQGYFGILISYKGGGASIAQATDINSLEYNITSSIYKLTRTDIPQIAIVGRGESVVPGQDPFATFKQIAGQQFNVRFASPEASVVPSDETSDTPEESEVQKPFVFQTQDKTALVIDDGAKSYTNEEIAKLKQFLSDKKNIIFFVNGVWVSPENLAVTNANHNLFGLLREWGIELEKNMVFSSSSELVNFGGAQFSIFLPYPGWLKTNSFNENSSYFSNIPSLSYLWTSSLKLNNKNGYDVRELVRTTNSSWQQTSNYVIDPQTLPEPKEKDLKPFVISAESVKKDGGKIMVIASNKFIEDQYLSREAGNLEFTLNVLNDYASDGALSGIRQRAVTIYPLPDLSTQEQEIYRYVNILLLPGLFGLYGIFRIYRRSKTA